MGKAELSIQIMLSLSYVKQTESKGSTKVRSSSILRPLPKKSCHTLHAVNGEWERAKQTYEYHKGKQRHGLELYKGHRCQRTVLAEVIIKFDQIRHKVTQEDSGIYKVIIWSLTRTAKEVMHAEKWPASQIYIRNINFVSLMQAQWNSNKQEFQDGFPGQVWYHFECNVIYHCWDKMERTWGLGT